MSNCKACKDPGLMKNTPTPKAVKSTDCPYMKACDQDVIKDEWELLCKDQEAGTDQTKMQSQMIHKSGHHCWEMCKRFVKFKVDEMEHRKPSAW